MAKEWAKPFYNSGAWKALRNDLLVKRGRVCEMCGGYATEVHHEIELTPRNINDPAVALNPKRLHCLCGDCHKQITKEQKGMGSPDCEAGFYFDGNGMLTPRGRGK